MTILQLRRWLTERLKEAEPLDAPSTMEHPQHVAITATKKLGLHGYGSGELMAKAARVATAYECAEVLADCLRAMPSDGPADPNTLAPSDVARILSVSEDTVLGWIHDRELRAANIASRSSNRPRWIIARADLDTFLRNRQPEPQPVAAARSNGHASGNGVRRY